MEDIINYKDLLGQTFGELIVIEKTAKRKCGSIVWKCQCSCGKQIWIKRANLLNGHTKSCGHLKLEENRQKVDGTIPGLLRSKLSKNNTSGYKGVSKTRNNKWIASITLRGKRYCLGTFSKKEDTIIARKKLKKII